MTRWVWMVCVLVMPLAARAVELQAGVMTGIRTIRVVSQFVPVAPRIVAGPTLRLGYPANRILTFETGYAYGSDLKDPQTRFNAFELGVRLQNRDWRVSPTFAVHVLRSWDRTRGAEADEEPVVPETTSGGLMAALGVCSHFTDTWSAHLDATAGVGTGGIYALLGRFAVAYRF